MNTLFGKFIVFLAFLALATSLTIDPSTFVSHQRRSAQWQWAVQFGSIG
jgi:hypothetical protein